METKTNDYDVLLDDRDVLGTGSESETAVFESEEVVTLLKNHDRTKLEETEIPVDIKDIAKKLEEKGYLLRIKPGGHLLVQDQNLSPQNSITVTRKNAYLEDANLQSRSAIALYNEMKENVLNAVENSFEETKERLKIEKSSAKIADISVFAATQDLLRTHMDVESNADFKDVFDESKAQYQFYDERGDEYLSLSLNYHVRDDDEKTVYPVLNARFGKEYSETEFSYEITQEDIAAMKNDTFYKTDLAKKVNELAGLGDKDRDFKFANIKSMKVKNLLDKSISKEFSFLNKDKIEYFSKVALEYYSEKRDVSLADFELEKLKDAPFYRSGMAKADIVDTLRESFDEIGDKINITDFKKMSRNTIEYKDFSCTKFESGEIAFDTNEKEPINYDREWINKLARLEDSILELRYGPVQDAVNIAKSIARGGKELIEGVAEFKVDGIYTGFDIGGGVTSFRDGWAYGSMIHSMEKEYQSLVSSESDVDKIAAIDKKMDLKLLREDVRDNANIYVKAAIALRENCDKMLDAIKSLRKEKSENTITESRFQSLKKQFAEYSKVFVNAYNRVRTAKENIDSNIRQFCQNTRAKGIDAINYAELKSDAVLNNVKDSFNEISSKAQVYLNMNEFNKECIAERMNDIRVEQVFSSLTYEQFNKEAKTRFWSELDNSINLGEEAKRIPESDRTVEDNQTIRFGNQMQNQKDQTLFVADQMRKEIKNCLKEHVPYSKAVERLAKAYNNESMTYRLRNSDSPIKTYNELSQADKQLCQNVVEDLLKSMPTVHDRFMEREEQERSFRFKDQQELSMTDVKMAASAER